MNNTELADLAHKLENAGVGVVALTPDGRWLRFNKAMCKIVGYSSTELAQKSFTDILHPENRSKDLGYLDQCYSGEIDSFAFKTHFLDKKGGSIPADLHVSSVRDDHDKLEYLLFTIVDRTEFSRLDNEREVVRLTGSIMSDIAPRVDVFADDVCATVQRLTRAKFVICAYIEPTSGRYTTVSKCAAPGDMAAYAPMELSLKNGPAFEILLSATGVLDTDRDGTLIGRLGITPSPQRLIASAWQIGAKASGFVCAIDRPAIHSSHTVATVESMMSILSLAIERAHTSFRLSQQNLELDQSIKKMALLVGSISALRDPYTADHEARVAELAQRSARAMGLEPSEVEGVYYSALLHDVGKIAVPLEILSKPGRLLEEEFLLVKKHTTVGEQILANAQLPWPCAEVALQHHERIDGSGYPAGLTGKDTHLFSKIVAVCDVAEAMASHRPYRPALGLAAAREEIDRGSGIFYDPKVVKAVLSVLDDGFDFTGVPDPSPEQMVKNAFHPASA